MCYLTKMHSVKLKNGTETDKCLVCTRNWEQVKHASQGLCRGCHRKSEYKRLIPLCAATPIATGIVNQLPPILARLCLFDKTFIECKYTIDSLSYGSPKPIWHTCPTCSLPKRTPFKLFIQNKNLNHTQCRSEHTKATNLQRYGVNNPLNRTARIATVVAATDQRIREAFAKENYVILDISRRSDREIQICFVCNKAHNHHITWRAWIIQNQRCMYCTGNVVNIQEIVASFKQAQFKLTTPIEQYVNNLTALNYECPNSHIGTTAWKYWQRGHRCPKCVSHQSRGEKEVTALFDNLDHKTSCVGLIEGKQELDIYFPNHKLAIEYCGLYWHSTQHERMQKLSYHYDKMKACNDKGIRLITIFEDEWINHKEICTSRINAALGLIKNKIPARKCKIAPVDKNIARDFLDNTHLQGATAREAAFGLFYNEILVSVATVGRPSRYHTSKEGTVLELKRFASSLDTIIVGGAAKLFTAIKTYARTKGFKAIKSYCDMRWGTGNVYKQLGFVLEGETKYTPHYTDGTKRYRNQTFAAKDGKTEQQLAEQASVFRIYDCGHQTWLHTL